MSEAAPPPVHPEHPDVSHEASDVDPRGLLLFTFLVVAVVAIVCVFLWWLFHLFAAREAKAKESVWPLAVPDRQRPVDQRLPPAPRLEGIDLTEEIRSGVYGWPSQAPREYERQSRQLEEYGWVDRQAGIARIPINEAMNRLAGKLPVRKEAEDSTQMPSDTNSGRSKGGSP